MQNQPTKKIPEAGRNAANVLSAHTLKVARPFFWHIGAKNRGVPRGASAFILRFDQHHVAVTANHVIESYLTDLAADSRTICQLGQCQVWPEKTLVARSEKLDIATFTIDPALLSVIGADVLDCRGQWPPPKVEVGDTLTLTGFLDNHRNKLAPQHYEMLAWGGHGIADAITELDIITTYDSEHMLAADFAVNKPSLGFNMSGCSGGPVVVIKDINGLLRWFPVGLIYKGPDGNATGELASFDRIHIRRLHFLKPDGTLDEPESGGWLPR
jgi:hypothetical protein